jgi:hypothetical protein
MTEPTANTILVTDSLGRTITIKKLSALDRMRIFEIVGPELSDNNQYLAYAMVAACVTAIDATAEATPRNKLAIESRIQQLGDEGIDAVARGHRDNFMAGETGDTNNVKN